MSGIKVAVIGAGISGLGLGYLLGLDDRFDMTLYEADNRLGGHSRTIHVEADRADKFQPVDTGFIVFNDWNYPHLMGLFRHLSVAFEKSDMSFGVSIDDGWLEYSSYNLLAQKRNIFRPQFWGMIRDILRFNKSALDYLERDPDVSLGQCLDELGMGEWFKRYFLLAMGAAIWSCPLQTMLKFPARTFVRFFKNHGLLSVNKRPQWYTVTGGSKEYVRLLREGLYGDVRCCAPVKSVRRDDDKVYVSVDGGNEEIYDHVVFACHADQALSIMQDADDEEIKILEAFSYQDNDVITHKDVTFMPQNSNCWASWVYLNQGREDGRDQVSLSYWMNNLQNFESDQPVLVTLNPDVRPRDDLIVDGHRFSHPIFDAGAIKAQEKIPSIQGRGGVWHCGAYQRYGFHEDGLWSAVRVAKGLGVRVPWE